MPLFQQSVLRKFIEDINKDSLKTSWNVFRKHFHDPKVQENVRNLKEEEYQEGFVRDLFVSVLGYTLNPQPGFNVVLEKKSVTDATKSDGAILNGNDVIAVIELKDTGTPDLNKVATQAFGYKHKHKNCAYVITSNFEKLFFYINDSTEYEEFDLFNLSFDQFALLYICLQKNFLLSNLPLQIKANSLIREETITKKLYADYSEFRKALFTNISDKNNQYDKLLLFNKTQKLLDRFLFILFAEDRLLVPPNSVREILQQWEDLKSKYDEYFPLYDRFKKYFGYLNEGHKGKQHEIFAYNGGLFADDEVLNNINIDDAILYQATETLSAYGFETDIDVNILGHIFEHSLTEIEELQGELEGKAIDKTKTKRKKDGVYYTPRYITKYIVENTIGALCMQKKDALNIDELNFAPGKRKDNRRKLIEKLDTYRDWLLQLTICDPACGSGAFLNAALEYLILEHRIIDELKAKVFGASIVYSDIVNSILENNLFGVDINEDAIEIAKLSLWLRTAQKGRKLSNLSKHIKCGNSIIDDPIVSGEKAFDWKKEFPTVFQNDGFDILISNPPYVDVKQLPKEMVKYLFDQYQTTENRINLYSIFIEKGLSLIKESGLMSYITPNSMLTNSSYGKLRLLIINTITNLVKLPDDVFEEAKVETILFILQKNNKSSSVDVLTYSKDEEISSIDTSRYKQMDRNDWNKSPGATFNIYATLNINSIFERIESDTIPLVELCDFSLGLTPYDKYKGHSQEDIKNRIFHSENKLDETYKPLVTGENITRYFTNPSITEYIKYGPWLSRPREERFFTTERIIVRQIVSGIPPRIFASYANQPFYFTHHGFAIIPKNKDSLSVKYILGLINSKLVNFYHTYKFLDVEKRLFQKVLIENCKRFPIKVIDAKHQEPFINKVDAMILLVAKLEIGTQLFFDFLKAKFKGIIINKKIENWWQLNFSDFLKELKKQGIVFTLVEQAEWLQYFEKEMQNMKVIHDSKESLDKELDEMVYELYELTVDEINTIETL